MTETFRDRLRRGVIAGAFICSLITGPAMMDARQADNCPLQAVSLPLFDATPAADIAATPQIGESHVTDANLEAELVAAAEIIVACSNADDPALRYAVFTERYLATFFLGDQPADQPAFERMIATGSTVTEEPMELIDVADIEVAEDGRVLATLSISTPNRDVNDRLLLAWNSSAAAWLVDDIVELDPPVPVPGSVT